MSPTFLQKEMEKLRARYQRGCGGWWPRYYPASQLATAGSPFFTRKRVRYVGGDCSWRCWCCCCCCGPDVHAEESRPEKAQQKQPHPQKKFKRKKNKPPKRPEGKKNPLPRVDRSRASATFSSPSRRTALLNTRSGRFAVTSSSSSSSSSRLVEYLKWRQIWRNGRLFPLVYQITLTSLLDLRFVCQLSEMKQMRNNNFWVI